MEEEGWGASGERLTGQKRFAELMVIAYVPKTIVENNSCIPARSLHCALLVLNQWLTFYFLTKITHNAASEAGKRMVSILQMWL